MKKDLLLLPVLILMGAAVYFAAIEEPKFCGLFLVMGVITNHFREK